MVFVSVACSIISVIYMLLRVWCVGIIPGLQLRLACDLYELRLLLQVGEWMDCERIHELMVASAVTSCNIGLREVVNL